MADKTTKKPKTEAEKEKARAERERTKARKTIKAARKAGKGSFGKAKPGVRAIAGGKKLSVSAEARLNAAVQKEVESGRIKVGNRVYVMGKPEMTSAEYSKMISKNSLAETIREIAKTDPVYAAEVRAREFALETGASRAEAEKAGKQAAKEEAARQKAKASGKVAPKETPKAEEKPKAKKPTAKKPIVKKLVVKESTLKDIDKLGEEYKKKTQAIGEKREALNKAAKNVSKASVATDFEDKIKAVEKQMSDNAKAVRAGTMTEAEKVKANKALAEQKNKLQADAKKAGVKVNNPATRPPRQPKAEKPAVKKTKVEKKTKPAPKKTTAKPVAEKPAAEKPVKGKGKTTAKSGAKTGAKTGAKAAGGKALTAAEKAAVKEITKAGAKRFSLGGLARAALKPKGAGLVGAALTGLSLFDYISNAQGPSDKKLTKEQKLAIARAKLKKNPTLDKTLAKGVPSPFTGKSSKKDSVKQGNNLAGKRYQAMADTQKVYGPKKLISRPINPAVLKDKSKPAGTKVNKSGQTVITIKRGDTLWDIAKKNNTTVDAIYKANPFLVERKKAGKTQIFSGTTIRLPKK